MKRFTKFVAFIAIVAAFTSCSTLNKSMREPNSRVEFEKKDFTLSDQVSAEATCTKILNIDFARLFSKTSGNVEGGAATMISLSSIPVVGNMITDKTASYALYELMNANPGYDVVFYPQFETKVVKPIALGFLMKTTTVKTTARLGKLNK